MAKYLHKILNKNIKPFPKKNHFSTGLISVSCLPYVDPNGTRTLDFGSVEISIPSDEIGIEICRSRFVVCVQHLEDTAKSLKGDMQRTVFHKFGEHSFK